ncbi:integrase [Devosia pacifica]|uniref:Integrase n=2 Tax=Devosia pacifica TaxID=1335967 RepID=A0A918VP29_9HYPH|nr:integrase [Devosia pacifica]
MASITKRNWTKPNGEEREAWLLTWFDASGKRHRKQFARKREADAARIEKEGEVAKGTFRAGADKFTVEQAVGDYVKHLEARNERDQRVTRTYLDSTRAELENYVLAKPRDEESKVFSRATTFTDGIGHMKLARLTPADVDDWKDKLLAAGVTVATTRRVLSSLRRVLAYAITKNNVAINAAAGVKVVTGRKDAPKKIVPPSKATLKAMLEVAPSDMRLRIAFAAATGLRASEQWALRWHHLDLDGGEVTVETRVDAHAQEGFTKSEAGTRTVPLGSGMVAQLEAWRKRSPYPADTDLVFPNTRGGYVRHGNMIKREYKALLDKLEGERPNWHALRHFAVSSWIAAGLPPKTIQTFAGHATLAITMDRYGHLFPGETHKAAFDRLASDIFG